MKIDQQTGLEQAVTLVDDLFDERQTKNYRLAMLLGADGLEASVWDDAYNKIIALEQYNFSKASLPASWIRLTDAAIRSSVILHGPYKQVSLSIVNPDVTLVPAPLFDASEKDTILKINRGPINNAITTVDTLTKLDAKNIFALPKQIEAHFKELYPNIVISHYSSSLIEYALLTNKNEEGKKIIVNARYSTFDVLVIESGKLLFFNQFPYQTPEDLVYYTLFAFEQLSLNPETATLELIGDIDKNSAPYRLLYKYIRKVNFGIRHNAFEFSFKLLSLPEHRYYNLLSQFLYK